MGVVDQNVSSVEIMECVEKILSADKPLLIHIRSTDEKTVFSAGIIGFSTVRTSYYYYCFCNT